MLSLEHEVGMKRSRVCAASGELRPRCAGLGDRRLVRDGHWPGSRRRRRAGSWQASASRATSSTQRESSAGSIRPPSGSSATFAVATSPRSSHPRTATEPASRSPARCSVPRRPPRRPASWSRPPGRGCDVELSAVPLKNGEAGGRRLRADRGTPRRPRRPAPHPHLTPRQVEVLRLLEQGRSTKQIAAELHLSTETVRNHVRRLFRALGVHSRLEAVAAARVVMLD